MTFFGHVAGVPLEEALPTITPVAFLLAVLARTRARYIMRLIERYIRVTPGR
jgi:hypothetical protein